MKADGGGCVETLAKHVATMVETEDPEAVIFKLLDNLMYSIPGHEYGGGRPGSSRER